MSSKTKRTTTCEECGGIYPTRLGRTQTIGPMLGGPDSQTLVVCPLCAKELASMERAMRKLQKQPSPGALSDECATCDREISVALRAWELMDSFWGKVVCANLCVLCDRSREKDAQKIAFEISERQEILRIFRPA